MKITARRLDLHEWDFDDVPEPQLVVCCVWEYAREAASIRRAVKYAKAAEVSKRKLLRAERVHEPFLNAVNKAKQPALRKTFTVSAGALGSASVLPARGGSVR
jgi:hypothetical protein